MNKKQIDIEAEREAKALKQQGHCNNQQHGRQAKRDNYNKVQFDKLFK